MVRRADQSEDRSRAAFAGRASISEFALAHETPTGNVASDGGGIFYNVGTTTLDAATRAATKGNAAMFSPNIGSA